MLDFGLGHTEVNEYHGYGVKKAMYGNDKPQIVRTQVKYECQERPDYAGNQLARDALITMHEAKEASK